MCLKKKLLLIIFMTFICFLLINISETMAYTGTLENGGVFTFPDNYYTKIENWKNTKGEMYCFFSYSSTDGYILTQEEINETGYNIYDLKLYLETIDGNTYVKFRSDSDIRVEFKVCNLWSNSLLPSQYTEKYGQAVKDLYWKCLFDNEYKFYSDFDIYTDSSCTELFYKSNTIPRPFVAPSLYPNSSENEEVLNSLKSGNFTFFIVSPGSLNENTDIILDFYDTTNSDSQNNIVQRFILNKNSVAFQYTDINNTEFQYVLTARFLPWFQIVNGKSYKATLSWVNPNNPLVTDSISYNWTMSLSAEQQITEEQKTQQEINQGINDLNNNIEETNDFLKDDSFDKDNIINNMPNSDNYEDPTANSFDNFFNTLRTAFTSENFQDIIIPIPFSDDKQITIPSNLTEDIIPDLLKNLIRMVYWYIISRFIVKDIASYIEKAKSGDIFSHTDTNIKTDML